MNELFADSIPAFDSYTNLLDNADFCLPEQNDEYGNTCCFTDGLYAESPETLPHFSELKNAPMAYTNVEYSPIMDELDEVNYNKSKRVLKNTRSSAKKVNMGF